MNIYDQMLSRYDVKTNDDFINAQHEVMQQVTLAGLYRGGFNNKAAFYGGSCLRIFYGLQRFSEDLDFSLLYPDKNFSLELYFDAIKNEFKSLGRNVTIEKKAKKKESNIESAFLKNDTAIYNIQFQTERNIKVKIEVDIDPPGEFLTEPRLLLLPFSFMTICYKLPYLFAGKMHALLFRKWKNRVKGRDWYDFEWYIRNSIPLNLSHFAKRVSQFEPSVNEELTKDWVKNKLKEMIRNTNIELVKKDVSPFTKNTKDLDIWSAEYFIQLAEMIQFESTSI